MQLSLIEDAFFLKTRYRFQFVPKQNQEAHNVCGGTMISIFEGKEFDIDANPNRFSKPVRLPSIVENVLKSTK